MSAPERLLLGPGPSSAPPQVLEALAQPVVGHFEPVFLALLDELAERLRRVFRTHNELTFAVSGTGSAGMEAALGNVLEPGDEVIVGTNGVFGARMCEVAQRLGARPVAVEAPWGEPVPPSAVQEALDAHPGARAVALVHAETSTGVAQPVEEISHLAHRAGALVVLDAVTSLGGMPVEVDAWELDVCYSGTQKCLSVPPGLAPITFSERAADVLRRRRVPPPSWYLDATLISKWWGSDRVYHHTPPVAMLRALHAGLGLVLEEGLEARWRRHNQWGARLAAGLEERGFEHVPHPRFRLPMLHCVRVPRGCDEATLRRRLRDEHGIEVGTGLGAFAGTCWRVGLMGWSATEETVCRFLNALDALLS